MREGNYKKQLLAVRGEFLKYDQEKMIRRFAQGHDSGHIYIDFYSRRYSVSRQTGEVLRLDDGAEASFEEVLSIYDILCYPKDGAALSGEWQTLANLSPHSNFGSASGSGLFFRAAESFAGRVDELKAACLDLGGKPCTRADVGYEFMAFADFPVVFQFWDGDEEFSPRVGFLFDSNALDFIHFETAWYVASHLIELITSLTFSPKKRHTL